MLLKRAELAPETSRSARLPTPGAAGVKRREPWRRRSPPVVAGPVLGQAPRAVPRPADFASRRLVPARCGSEGSDVAAALTAGGPRLRSQPTRPRRAGSPSPNSGSPARLRAGARTAAPPALEGRAHEEVMRGSPTAGPARRAPASPAAPGRSACSRDGARGTAARSGDTTERMTTINTVRRREKRRKARRRSSRKAARATKASCTSPPTRRGAAARCAQCGELGGPGATCVGRGHGQSRGA